MASSHVRYAVIGMVPAMLKKCVAPFRDAEIGSNNSEGATRLSEWVTRPLLHSGA